MNTKNRVIRLSEAHWQRLLTLAHKAGYADRSAYVRALIDGQSNSGSAIAPALPHKGAVRTDVRTTPLEDELTYDPDFSFD